MAYHCFQGENKHHHPGKKWHAMDYQDVHIPGDNGRQMVAVVYADGRQDISLWRSWLPRCTPMVRHGVPG